MGRQPGTLQGIYAAGGAGFLHEMLEVAGGDNVFEDIKRRVGPALAAKPCWRGRRTCCSNFAHERPRATIRPADLAVWDTLASVPAVRNRRVYSVVGDFVVVAGPRLAEGAEAIARVLHPEAFK